MAQSATVHPRSSWFATPDWVNTEIEVSVATYEAYQILYYTFIVLMSVAGLDKFLHLLTTWENYVSPGVASFFHLSAGAVAVAAGLIELGIAAAVALKPRVGSWAVTIWLGLIVINLLTMGNHYETLLMTAALVAGGVAFMRLSAECN
ncbi:MAG TPA: hypothetical protein VGL72_32640 [Bryobacteraceae bacterium]|jgi:hypothetical protein